MYNEECDFKEDLKVGKEGERQIRIILDKFNIKHWPNPNKYGHVILSEMGTIEVKKSNLHPLVEVYHDIRTFRKGWGWDKISDVFIVIKDNKHFVIDEEELLRKGVEQICKRLRIHFSLDLDVVFKLALDNNILKINKKDRWRGNQSAYFQVSGIKMIPLEDFIRRWKIEQNHSWECLKPDTGT